MSERNQPESINGLETDLGLERLIGTSIASYGEPSPDSELAQRILARIAAEPRQAVSRRWLPWVIFVPITACLITAFAWFELRPVHVPDNPTDQARITAPLGKNAPASVSQASPYQSQRERRSRVTRIGAKGELATAVAKAEPLPKLDVFPTPQPLTPAEQALVQFATYTSAAERTALLKAQQQPDAPLTIAAIKIQPIEMPDLGN